MASKAASERRRTADRTGGAASVLGAATLLLAASACTSPPASQSASATGPASAAGPVSPSLAAPPVAAPPGSAAVHPKPDQPAPVAAPAAAPARQPGSELARFFATLRGLEDRSRKTHVHVLWLGDSHGASDFWSGGLRKALQQRFGSGGAGFVHVGNTAYRHDDVKIAADGKWTQTPRLAASIERIGSGVYGLGGYTMSASAPASATLTLAAAAGKLSWDLCYRLSAPGDALEVSAGGPAKRITGPSAGGLAHVVIAGEAGKTELKVSVVSGNVELCGVVAESDPAARAGVVLDTLGINGARLKTPLTWDEAAWTAEAARRAPDLVVLEYGTNECGDPDVDPATYTGEVTSILARIRKTNADADCVVLAPTDRADTEDRNPLVRDGLRRAAAANGCAFWDTYETMGGKGAIKRWRDEAPPRAAHDGVHLVSRGYRELGAKLAELVLAGYSR